MTDLLALDLSTPPTRKTVGLEDGEQFAQFADEGTLVAFTLPGDVELVLPVGLGTADSYRTGLGPPSTVDVHSVGTSLDEAVDLAVSVADLLDIDPSEVIAWRARLDATEQSEDVQRSPYLQTDVNDLNAALRVSRIGSGSSYLHLVLTWDRERGPASEVPP